LPIKCAMATTSPSPRLTELVEGSATRLTILLGALRTLQVPDPRISPVVLEEILGSAMGHAIELEGLLNRLSGEIGGGSGVGEEPEAD
jgi:hypothetical protein